METSIDNQSPDDFMQEPARPQFISVLCILTWICCALIFITTFWKVAFPETTEQKLEKAEQIRKYNPEAADQMEALIEKQQDEGGGQIIGNILTLIGLGLSAYGAFLMWQLKRTGFYFYLTGEIVPYLGFVVVGTDELKAAGSMSGMGSMIVALTIGVMLLFDAIFIVMYSVNLKHMKR